MVWKKRGHILLPTFKCVRCVFCTLNVNFYFIYLHILQKTYHINVHIMLLLYFMYFILPLFKAMIAVKDSDFCDEMLMLQSQFLWHCIIIIFFVFSFLFFHYLFIYIGGGGYCTLNSIGYAGFFLGNSSISSSLLKPTSKFINFNLYSF